MCVSMMGLGLGLRDRGGRVYACIERVSTDSNGRVECFGVEVLEVDGIIRPGHYTLFGREDLDDWLRSVAIKRRKCLFWTLFYGRSSDR